MFSTHHKDDLDRSDQSLKDCCIVLSLTVQCLRSYHSTCHPRQSTEILSNFKYFSSQTRTNNFRMTTFPEYFLSVHSSHSELNIALGIFQKLIKYIVQDDGIKYFWLLVNIDADMWSVRLAWQLGRVETEIELWLDTNDIINRKEQSWHL